MRELREERGWSQKRLADELEEVGISVGQTGIARLENTPRQKKPAAAARSVSVEDLLALALVLDVPPVSLLLPAGQDLLQVAEKGAQPIVSARVGGPLRADRGAALAWMTGRHPLSGQRDPDGYRAAAKLTVEQKPRARRPAIFTLQLRELTDRYDRARTIAEREQILEEVARAALDEMRNERQVRRVTRARVITPAGEES